MSKITKAMHKPNITITKQQKTKTTCVFQKEDVLESIFERNKQHSKMIKAKKRLRKESKKVCRKGGLSRERNNNLFREERRRTINKTSILERGVGSKRSQ